MSGGQYQYFSSYPVIEIILRRHSSWEDTDSLKTTQGVTLRSTAARSASMKLHASTESW